MTEEFRKYVEQIRQKALELHQSLVVERERSGSLTAEISRLEGLLNDHKQTIEELRGQAETLQQSLDEQREQASQQSVNGYSDDQAIDGLVKEIDFCIQQLKLANE